MSVPAAAGSVVYQPARELQVDRQRDQVLLRAVVEVTLDAAAVGVGRAGRAAFGTRAALRPRVATVEPLPQHLDDSVQGNDLLIAS